MCSFRWDFGRSHFRQAGEEGIHLRDDVAACSTHSKSLPLPHSCDTMPWTLLQAPSPSLNVKTAGQIKNWHEKLSKYRYWGLTSLFTKQASESNVFFFWYRIYGKFHSLVKFDVQLLVRILASQRLKFLSCNCWKMSRWTWERQLYLVFHELYSVLCWSCSWRV